MACYVDPLSVHVSREPQARRAGARHGHRWCHLVSDTREELLLMARALGMRVEWLQVGRDGFAHFDLGPTKRAWAVQLGAKEITSRDVVAIRRAFRARKEVA